MSEIKYGNFKGDFMSEIKYGNFKNDRITCKRTSKRPE